jgi:hypothetical protein
LAGECFSQFPELVSPVADSQRAIFYEFTRSGEHRAGLPHAPIGRLVRRFRETPTGQHGVTGRAQREGFRSVRRRESKQACAKRPATGHLLLRAAASVHIACALGAPAPIVRTPPVHLAGVIATVILMIDLRNFLGQITLLTDRYDHFAVDSLREAITATNKVRRHA